MIKKILESEEDFNIHRTELNFHKSGEYGIKKCLHNGEPEEYPCIVLSSFRKKLINDDGERYIKAYYQHNFVYQHMAERLLNLVS